jgi:hypothetical protein
MKILFLSRIIFIALATNRPSRAWDISAVPATFDSQSFD